MKAIILAAGLDVGFDPTVKSTPKCLLEIGGQTLLERQIEILNLCGVKSEDIIVVVGSQGDVWSEKNKEIVRNIHKNIIINDKNLETKNTYSLFLVLDTLNSTEILCIDGDVLFNKEILDKVFKTEYSNFLLTKKADKFDSGNRVLLKKNRVRGIGPKILSDTVYVGVAKFSAEFVELLKQEIKSEEYFNESLDKPLYKLCIDNFIYSLEIEDSEKNDSFLNGGSYAITKEIFLKSRIPRENAQEIKIIRKEATEGKQKLINEIQWIINLPEDVKYRFPKVINYSLNSDPVYAEIEAHPMKTMRRSLIDGEVNAEKAFKILENLFDFMFNKLYSKNVKLPSKNLVEDIYFNRTEERFDEAKRKAKIFHDLINAEKIIINSKSYQNVPQIFQSLKKNKKFIEMLTPPFVNLIHGDLHFDNILIDGSDFSNFILIDPRGKMYNGEVEGDYAYDLGKTWHSLNGLYDFIHEGKFNLDIAIKNSVVSSEFNIVPYNALKEYKNIFSNLPLILSKYKRLKEDQYWDIRTSFNEVVHFCSMAPFHIKGDNVEKLAIAMYLRGVMLLDKFLDDLVFYRTEPELLHINTPQDYLEAKRIFGEKL